MHQWCLAGCKDGVPQGTSMVQGWGPMGRRHHNVGKVRGSGPTGCKGGLPWGARGVRVGGCGVHGWGPTGCEGGVPRGARVGCHRPTSAVWG